MSRMRLPLFAGTATILLVACGSSGTSSSVAIPTAPVTAQTSTSTSSAPASTPAATSAPAATGALSGTWSGQYTGAYQGTFTLTWQQSGSNLSGTIKLSAPPQTLNITGTVQGGAISFGTVGSAAITYTGSVSGNSMSGTYQVAGSSGGSWSASKTA
jgi:hypothetical protein